MKEKMQPWLSPDESVEGIEILAEVEECLRNTARFASMRKELRKALETEAFKVGEFVSRVEFGVIDQSLVWAMQEVASKKKITVNALVQEAIESYVSTFNRRKA